jgi:2-polyprenyl-3-methyl-5-hydroxy-6-metoxy-1,4-benzoquinol methylase
MSSREYHESLWEAVPEGLQPADLGVRLAFLLEHVEPGQRVLDIGCGEGRFATELERAGIAVVAADVAAEPLRRARACDPGLDLRLIASDRPWELEDSSFDVVWAGEVIEHVADTAGWLSEARRVLRSGGRLLLSTPAHPPLRVLAMALRPGSFDTHFDPLSEHLRFYTARTLRRLLGDFGFEEIRIRGVGRVPGAQKLMLASARRSRF